ncbi:MAG: AsmA family protein [Hylemonella sp.]|nr:AsmA family protein [Hylemonella sp.]MDP1937824.1 AsmA family protein [Hylemonella sp.]
MPKVLKYLLLALAGLVALLVLAALIIAATFNPNDYKPTLIKLVQDKTQRALSIPGDIKLTFFPRIGADLGKVAISERQNARVFASAEHAQVALALMPIFSRQFIIDQVLVDGLVVNLHRYKNNTTNYDDLLSKEDGNAKPATATPTPEEAHAVQFDVGGISLTNARLGLTDETKNSTLAVSKLNLRTGPIAQGKKSNFELSAEVKGDKPQLALTVNAKSNFTLDLTQQRHVFDGFTASLKGAAVDMSNLQMTLSAPSFELSPQALKAPALALEAAITQGTRSTTAKLGGALSGDLVAQRFELSNLSLDAALPNPAGGSLALSAKGKASVNLPREAVQASLSGKLDGMRMEAQVGLTRFSPPAYSFDIALDDLDADRYLTKSTPTAKTGAGSGTAPESPIDLSALQSLDARGTLKVASFKFANIRTSNVRLELHAANGKVNINPMTASLYGGSLAGSLSASASKTPRFAVQQTLRNINIGPLLKDALDKNPVDGKGDVTIDISTTGATVSQLKRAINGTARLALQDGAINGINLAATIRNAKARIGMLQGQPAPQQGTASTQEKTDFTELNGSFKIANGVAHNDDLSAKTPLLRIGGNGDINLGEDRLDYTVKATVVSTLQGQGGPELQQLKGLTVPVKLSGPFNAIRWEIDFGSLVGDLVKGKVEAEVQKQVDTQKGQLEQQLKDQLKGLFGK